MLLDSVKSILYSSFFCFLQQEKSETGFAFPSVLCGYLIRLCTYSNIYIWYAEKYL